MGHIWAPLPPSHRRSTSCSNLEYSCACASKRCLYSGSCDENARPLRGATRLTIRTPAPPISMLTCVRVFWSGDKNAGSCQGRASAYIAGNIEIGVRGWSTTSERRINIFLTLGLCKCLGQIESQHNFAPVCKHSLAWIFIHLLRKHKRFGAQSL